MTTGKTRTKKAESGPTCPEGLNLPPRTREDYVAGVLEQIGAFEERLETLEADMESSGWDDIGEYRNRLDDLRVRLKGLRGQSVELEGLADAGWPEAREDMDGALEEVGAAIEELVAGLSLVLPE